MTAVGRSGGLAVIVAGALLTARPPDRLSAQSLWRPDERAVISDFSYIRAIAASPSLVFAATTYGMTIYDRQARAWQTPITTLDDYPVAAVRVALADPAGNAVWLGTDFGWARYDADIRRWDQGYVAGGVSSLMLDSGDPASGVYIRSPVGWGFLPRGGLAPVTGQPLPPPGRRLIPLSPEAALQMAPMADALRAFILTDARLRSVQFTSATRTLDRSELFFGTSGMGIVRFDPTTTDRERLVFGLLAPRAGSVVTTAGGVWVTSLSRVGERSGLTWVGADLGADSTVEGAGAVGLGCLEGRHLVVTASTLWLACERGLLKVDVATGRSRLLDPGAVMSLAPAPDGVWVGTTHGLARVTSDDQVHRVGTFEQAVLSLLAARDSVWVGTAGGLGLLLPGETRVVVPPDVADYPALSAPILALGNVGGALLVVTPDQFAWRDPATHRWTLTHARTDLGAISAIAGDTAARGAWVAGTDGVAFWDLTRGSFHVLRAPDDVPAVVHDVAVDSRFVWVATDGGLVRFTRAAALGR